MAARRRSLQDLLAVVGWRAKLEDVMRRFEAIHGRPAESD